ncbi:hypothetical protein [Nocardioides pocheonensis]|uniref:SgcJ/EcaC family oxidoreductase n=1 Tax=Nocardioides pocheonensis TaxID=661485 RepID=A0A3N0GNM9_9ACTN|nr:hypothetical protein [Nocardioides pocheonensis]RNM14073.1 hypothetical protein EFL26_14145 [Nocardioides pocheonensis]
MAVRIPRALLVLTAGLTVGLVGVVTLAHAPTSVPRAVQPAAPAPVHASVGSDGVLAVLHDWDVRRAAAWAAGDPDALARLYTPQSRAGAADVAMLRRYVARGLVVRDMRMQVLRARVVTARPRLLELQVTDRLAAAVAVGVGDPTAERRLPADVASTHLLVLRRSGPGQGWLVARVSASSGR